MKYNVEFFTSHNGLNIHREKKVQLINFSIRSIVGNFDGYISFSISCFHPNPNTNTFIGDLKVICDKQNHMKVHLIMKTNGFLKLYE